MVATKGIGLRTSQKGISGIGYILQQLADIFWYWIYSANNWEIYVNYGVFVRPSGAGLQIVHLLEYVRSIFCNPTPSNCWQNKSNTYI